MYGVFSQCLCHFNGKTYTFFGLFIETQEALNVRKCFFTMRMTGVSTFGDTQRCLDAILGSHFLVLEQGVAPHDLLRPLQTSPNL